MTGTQRPATATGRGRGRGPRRRPPTRPDTQPASTSTAADAAGALDWPASPCPGHPPFDSCGPALSAEPWPAPPDAEPPDQEPLYGSTRLAERSAETGSLQTAIAWSDLEGDHERGHADGGCQPGGEIVGEGGDSR